MNEGNGAPSATEQTASPPNASGRIDAITWMSVVCALAVVTEHMNGVFWQFDRQDVWFSANVIESVFYFCVPLFFMISGVTLIGFRKRYDLRTYAGKRFRKAVLPFVVWSLVGGVFRLPYQWEALFDHPLSFLYNGVLGTKFIDIYWFFIPLFCLYLVYPALGCVREECRAKAFGGLVAASLLLDTAVPFFVHIFHLPLKYDFAIFGWQNNYLIYPLLGYVLWHAELSQKARRILYALAVLGLLLHAGGTYLASMQAGALVTLYKGFLNLPCVLYSAGAFVALREVTPAVQRIGWLWRLVTFLAPYTLAIYLLQGFFLLPIRTMFDVGTFAYRIGGIAVLTYLCVGMAWVIRKLPGGKKILP